MSVSHSFIEGWIPDDIDPMARDIVADGNEIVVEAIDGHGEETIRQLADERAAKSVRRLLELIVGPDDCPSPGFLERMGRRALALCWLVDSRMLHPDRESIRSMSSICRDIGITSAYVSPDAARFARELKFQNPWQVHTPRNHSTHSTTSLPDVPKDDEPATDAADQPEGGSDVRQDF